MSKSVLFVCYGLGIGGIEKCLVNLINQMKSEEFEIDVLLMNPEYELKKDIHRNVHYLDSYLYVMNTTTTMRNIKHHGGILKNLNRFFKYIDFRVRVKLNKAPWKSFDSINKNYDIAIAYSQNDYSAYYVIDKVRATRKILWYHNGAYEKSGKYLKRDKMYYNVFDYVVAVSSDCALNLQNKIGLSKNLIVLRNFYDTAEIIKLADNGIPESFGLRMIHIVTVGRMTKEKGAQLAVDACQILKKDGYNICWHWIGDGNQRSVIEKKIKDAHLEQIFILEGNQINPYPYIKNADIYVQTSLYEAFSTTVTEAKVLGKPIVTTDVGGMRDQLIDKKTGIIVSISAKAIAKGIAYILDNNYSQMLINNVLKDSENQDNNWNKYLGSVFR